MLKIDNLTKSFGEKIVLDGFSANFPSGSRTLITGQSGKGKTTLLRIIAGLETPDSGKVLLPRNAVVAMMFQEPRLFPWMSVIDNVSSVLDKADTDRIAVILCELGLENEGKAMPSELSGGMQRRVSLARTLLYPADVYLLDEPFAGLDPDMAQRAANVMFKYTKDKTVIIVSHDRSMLPDDIETVVI